MVNYASATNHPPIKMNDRTTRRDLFRRALQVAPALILPELILPTRTMSQSNQESPWSVPITG